MFDSLLVLRICYLMNKRNLKTVDTLYNVNAKSKIGNRPESFY